jgi:hypothetical protein
VSTSDRVAATTALCAVVAIALPITLWATWSYPTEGPDDGYTGWQLLKGGLGSGAADQACGTSSCAAGEVFVTGAVPTVALLLLAIALALPLAPSLAERTTRVAGTIIVLAVLTLLGVVGELAWLGKERANHASDGQVLGSGIEVAAYLAVVALALGCALLSQLRRTPIER